jgi:autotransporter strand-loop-strand O-heptosyltransferase
MKILGHASYVGNTGYNAHSKGFFRALSKKVETKVRNFTIGPNWSGYIDKYNNPHNSDVNNLDKNILISQSLFDADRNLNDFPLYNYDNSYVADVNIILNSVNHYYFYQSYKGPKIGYVVWENTLYPQDFFGKLLECDQVWVPTEWQAKITIDQGIPANKVKIVREAVNPEIYETKTSPLSNDVFTFVLFGAWGDRKSTKEIIRSFINVFGNNSKVQLILSVANNFNNDGFANTHERLKANNLYASNINIVDFVPREDYIRYIQNAHVFLSCARGEGWNIPLIEAMACGVPSIYSNCSGQLEFAKDKGIPVNIRGLVLAKDFPDNKNQNSPGYWYEPDFQDLKNKMLEVYNNYSFYKEKAIEESKHIRNTFTWENAADAAMNHLKELSCSNIKLEVSCSFVGTGGLNTFCQELLPELNNYCDVKIRNYTIGKNWNGYNETPHDLDIEERHKQILHKQTLYNSDGSRSDYPIYNHKKEFTPNINLVMEGLNHYYFYDDYVGPKIAYTMYESTEFPQGTLNQLRTFDQLWIPSQWQKDNLIKQNFPENKLKVVPLGVDENIFFPISEKFTKFTFVLVGRWDARKSTMEIIKCFKEKFENNDDVQLLLLVDNPFDIDGLGSTKNRLKHYNLNSENIKVLSFTTKEEYVSILKRSHVFLSCSRAEGWNLPLIEAMACGTVSVYSNCSAQLEFAKNLGVPINIVGEEPASLYNQRQFDKNIVGNYYIPDFIDLSNKILDIYKNYAVYNTIAIQESIVIREKFSWKRASLKAYENMKSLISEIKNTEVKNIEFVKFIRNSRGIEYKNISDKTLSVKIKIFDTALNSYPHEENLTLDANGIYYTTLYEDYQPKDKLEFTIFDNSNNLLLSIEKSFTGFKNLDYYIIKGKDVLNDKDLSFRYSEKDNTLYFNTMGKEFHDVKIIIKDLNSNLTFSSFLDQASIINGINYFATPTNSRNLDLEFFNGCKLMVFKDKMLLFEVDVPIENNLYNKSNCRKFYYDDESALSILDYFFCQKIDFYYYDFYKNNIKENDVIIDIGASCGTLVDFCISRNVSKIIALEPSASFNILEKTFQKENKVIVENKAISIDNENKNLTLSPFTTLSILEEDSKSDVNTVSVKCISLDHLFFKYNLDKVDVLKIDIEGFEYKIFENISYSVLEKINKIILEFHLNDGIKLTNVKNKLKLSGFAVKQYDLFFNENSDFNLEKGVLFAFKTQTVDIINESGSLGDAIAWTGIIDSFQKEKNKQINFYTPYKNLFQDAYPNINFYNYWEKPLTSTESYHIGCFDIDGIKWNQLSLQEIACKILKIKNKEIRSKVALPKDLKNNFKRKYVCIGSLSTSQAKFWNNPSGWTRTVEYLNSLGYDVVSIDKNNNIGCGEHVNYIPVNSIDKTGDFPLSDRINDLYFCDFFIGLGSGLSWLAWAVGKPVIMISGFSDPVSEFYTPYRVINRNVCNSCWNDPDLTFDKGNWAWCPRNKNFECSKEISFEMVKEKIDQCIKDLNKYS